MRELYDKKSSKQMIQWTLSLSPLGFKVMILFVESLPLSIEYDDDTHLDTCHRIWQEFGNMTRGQNSSILLAINMCPHDKNQLVV